MARGIPFLILLLSAGAFAGEPNTLTPDEAAAGFRLLFDGRTLDGWSAPKNNWHVNDGALHLRHRGGSIQYSREKLAQDFDLRFEWMLGPEGNSGVHYRGGQFEYQVLDNRSSRVRPSGRAGALYGIAGAETDSTRPPMQWNEGRIECHGSRVRHWVNGELTADVDLASPAWADAVEKERQRRLKYLPPGPAREGFLALSDHTGTVWFRSIRLKTY